MSARGDARKRLQQKPGGELDLTEAVDAAARAYYTEDANLLGNGRPWEDLKPIEQWAVRNAVLPIVAAAMPAIASAVLVTAVADAPGGMNEWVAKQWLLDRAADAIAAGARANGGTP